MQVHTNIQLLGGGQLAVTNMPRAGGGQQPAPIVRPGAVWVLRGRGLPASRAGGAGDLYLEFEVEFPEKLLDAPRGSVLPAAESAKERLAAVVGDGQRGSGSGVFGKWWSGGQAEPPGGGEAAGAQQVLAAELERLKRVRRRR